MKKKKILLPIFLILDCVLLAALALALLMKLSNNNRAVIDTPASSEISASVSSVTGDVASVLEPSISDAVDKPSISEEESTEISGINNDLSIYDIPFEDGYEFPDLSAYDFVFIGDSIFDMSFSDTSMPRQLEVYTNSGVYNLSKNMSAAADNSNSQISLTGLTECFVNGKDTGYSENRSFNRDIARYNSDKHKGKKLVIIINHCINDYTFSSPIYNEADANDINTYEGALRSNIAKIKNAYPKAIIVYMEPYIVGINNCGSDPNYYGYTLDDYVGALERVAGENGVMLFNLRSYAFFAEYRDGYLLDDYIHPNEMCSKTMARLFCDFVINNIPSN